MPAAAVIPAPAVYTNIAAVKTLVVDCRVVGVDQPWVACQLSAGQVHLWVAIQALLVPGQFNCLTARLTWNWFLSLAYSSVIMRTASTHKACDPGALELEASVVFTMNQTARPQWPTCSDE